MAVTKTQQTKALEAVRKAFKPWLDDERGLAPKLMDYQGHPAVVWEDGAPYDWAILASLGGGIEEEFGFEVPAVEYPAGIYGEPWNGYVLNLFEL